MIIMMIFNMSISYFFTYFHFTILRTIYWWNWPYGKVICSMHFGSFTNFLLFLKSKLDNFSNRAIPWYRQSKSHPLTSRLVNDFISFMYYGSFTNLLLLLKSKSNNFSNHPIHSSRKFKSHPPPSSKVNNFISSMHSGNFPNLLVVVQIQLGQLLQPPHSLR
jgi:hypothetical protein